MSLAQILYVRKSRCSHHRSNNLHRVAASAVIGKACYGDQNMYGECIHSEADNITVYQTMATTCSTFRQSNSAVRLHKYGLASEIKHTTNIPLCAQLSKNYVTFRNTMLHNEIAQHGSLQQNIDLCVEEYRKGLYCLYRTCLK